MKRPDPVSSRNRPDGDADEHEGRRAHEPPEGIPELAELDSLWEDLVTSLPSLPNR